jgi:hypothetical protein
VQTRQRSIALSIQSPDSSVRPNAPPARPAPAAAPTTARPAPALPTALSVLLAQDRFLDELGAEAHRRWSHVREDLNQPFWAEKYAAKPLADAKEMLTGFLAEGSSITLGNVEKSLDKLSTSLLPAKTPADLEKTFWQRVGEARHECYLSQLSAILKAAEIATQHALAKAEYTTLSFATTSKASKNQRAARSHQDQTAPRPSTELVFTPPVGKASYHSLPFAERGQVRDQIRLTLNDIDRLSQTGLSETQQAALSAYLRTVRAYTKDQANPGDLSFASAGLDAAQSRRGHDPAHPADSAWRCVVLDARNTATLAQQLSHSRAPPAPAVVKQPEGPPR